MTIILTIYPPYHISSHNTCLSAQHVSEPLGLNPGTLPLPLSWQPVKEKLNKKEDNQEEMNNKVNKVKVAYCVDEGYEFPVEEVDYVNMVWNEDKEVLTKNKDSPNEQLAGQADVPRQRPEWPDPETYKRHS